MEKQKALSGMLRASGESGLILVYTATRRRPEKGRIIITAAIITLWFIVAFGRRTGERAPPSLSSPQSRVGAKLVSRNT